MGKRAMETAVFVFLSVAGTGMGSCVGQRVATEHNVTCHQELARYETRADTLRLMLAVRACREWVEAQGD